MLMAASQKKKMEKMWTRFEDGSCVTLAGLWDTSQDIVGGKARASGKAETQARNMPKDQENDERHGKERFRQIWRIQGGILRRTERSGIPRTVLDVRQERTQSHQNVDGESVACVDDADAENRRKRRTT